MVMVRGEHIKILFFCFLVSWCTCTKSTTTHVVGDAKGWDFSVSYTNWADDKTFAIGDLLVFNYPAGRHNVVPVSIAGYRNCKVSMSDMAKVKTTGKDKFTLSKGANYFICSYSGHCTAGMKIQVNAT